MVHVGESLNSTEAVFIVASSRGCPQQVARVMLVDFGERHRHTDKQGSTSPEQTADRPVIGKRVWQAERGSRRTRRHPREEVVEEGYEETVPVELQLNAAVRRADTFTPGPPSRRSLADELEANEVSRGPQRNVVVTTSATDQTRAAAFCTD